MEGERRKKIVKGESFEKKRVPCKKKDDMKIDKEER